MTSRPNDARYHGYRCPDGTGVVTDETADGHYLAALPHHLKHSPDGFNWGYAGSGPAELARCLLLDALEDPHCAGLTTLEIPGSRERPYQPHRDDPRDEAVDTCWHCDDDHLVPVPYQAFKYDHVAGWGQEWIATRDELRAWLTTHLVTAGAGPSPSWGRTA